MDRLADNAVRLIARAGGTIEEGQKAPGQGGILEGQDPTHYDSKNPVS